MADRYSDQTRNRYRDQQQGYDDRPRQQDQFAPYRSEQQGDDYSSRHAPQYGERSDHFDERGYGRSDRFYDDDHRDDEYRGDFGRSFQDRDDTRSYPQDRDRLSQQERTDARARWGTMEGREWGPDRHNRYGGGHSGRPNPDPVPPIQGRGRSRGGYDDYGGRGYGDDYDSRGYGGRGYETRGRRRRGHDGDRGFFDKAGDEVASWFGDDDAERRREMDHRGRGPSNYKRSDERLMEDACERLTHEPRVDARQIKVTAKDNEITLDGHVTSRFQKREAEDCVHEISGVKHVQNNLRIADRDDSTSEDPATRGARKQTSEDPATRGARKQ
jgi:osmotically-inducible protein OsmY